MTSTWTCRSQEHLFVRPFVIQNVPPVKPVGPSSFIRGVSGLHYNLLSFTNNSGLSAKLRLQIFRVFTPHSSLVCCLVNHESVSDRERKEYFTYRHNTAALGSQAGQILICEPYFQCQRLFLLCKAFPDSLTRLVWSEQGDKTSKVDCL